MLASSDIKALRDRLELTQAQFAERLGVDQGTISNWERGVTTPGGPARKILATIAEGAAKPSEEAA